MFPCCFLLWWFDHTCISCRHLAQNPFICDCNLKWLADYLRSNPIETSGARCASPRRLANKRIGQIKSKKFRCSGKSLSLSLSLSLSQPLSQPLSLSLFSNVSLFAPWFSLPVDQLWLVLSHLCLLLPLAPSSVTVFSVSTVPLPLTSFDER